MSYRIEPFTDGYDLDAFTCGNPTLDLWIKQHAHSATGQGTRTYLAIEQATSVVAGYFAIAPHLVERDETPRGVSRGAPQRIPAILLAKLALHKRLHGRGLGADLLVYALTTIVAAARSAGGRIVVVDAIDENAASFYSAHDFRPSPTDPHRLVMKISTAAHALGLTWP